MPEPMRAHGYAQMTSRAATPTRLHYTPARCLPCLPPNVAG